MSRGALVQWTTIHPDGRETNQWHYVKAGEFCAFGDGCLELFGKALPFLTIPPKARILEVGCFEADWLASMALARPDCELVGIDWQPCVNKRNFGTPIQGDVLTYDFEPASFDAVVGISSIEHIGLGHYKQDPLDPDGDRHCMERIVSWLKPGGIVYADVPWQPDRYEVNGTKHRVYHPASVAERLLVPGLVKTWETWSTVNGEALLPEPSERHPHFWVYAFQAVKG